LYPRPFAIRDTFIPPAEAVFSRFVRVTGREWPFIQANVWDFIPAAALTGFEDFIVTLTAETKAFGKPVVLVHGDSHYFRIDKPLPSALPSQVKDTEFPFIMPWESATPRLHNFTRVETFGNPNSHWVKVNIDRHNPSVFSFEEEMVQKNIVK